MANDPFGEPGRGRPESGTGGVLQLIGGTALILLGLKRRTRLRLPAALGGAAIVYRGAQRYRRYLQEAARAEK